MENRLIDLEVRYSYLERSLAELDAVVVDLRAQIDALRLRATRLEDMASAEGDEAPPHEKPPHY